jgi:hypothetical protein
VFDKTFTLTSTDGTVSVEITAGTEGVRDIQLIVGPQARHVTTQQLIDLLAPAVKAALSAPSSSGPSTSSAS